MSSHSKAIFWIGVGMVGMLGIIALGADGTRLLPEGTVLRDIDGAVITNDANDGWVFKLEHDVNHPVGWLSADAPLPLLTSATLETLLVDANDRRAPRYRVSGQVTQYRGRNFLLPSYFLPLSILKDANEPVRQDLLGADREGQRQGGRGMAIPSEILQKLNERQVLPGPRLREPQAGPRMPEPGKRGRVLVDRVGFIEVQNGRFTFVPDAFGWNVSAERYELLPCTALERAERQQAALSEPPRVEVAGLVSEFRGKKCLLLQRVVRVYSYGNFGR